MAPESEQLPIEFSPVAPVKFAAATLARRPIEVGVPLVAAALATELPRLASLFLPSGTAMAVVLLVARCVIGALAVTYMLALALRAARGGAAKPWSRGAPVCLALVVAFEALLIGGALAVDAAISRYEGTVTSGQMVQLLVAAATVLLPILFLLLKSALAPMVAMDRQVGPVAALRRSWRLTRGFVFPGLVLFVILTGVVAALCSIVPIVGDGVFGAVTALSVVYVYLLRSGELIEVAAEPAPKAVAPRQPEALAPLPPPDPEGAVAAAAVEPVKEAAPPPDSVADEFQRSLGRARWHRLHVATLALGGLLVLGSALGHIGENPAALVHVMNIALRAGGGSLLVSGVAAMLGREAAFWSFGEWWLAFAWSDSPGARRTVSTVYAYGFGLTLLLLGAGLLFL